MAATVLDVDVAKSTAIDLVDAASAEFQEVNRAIWTYAEPSLLEFKSAELLAALLERNGFSVQRGVAGMPTAFIATWGRGQPVVGVMAEYDALPGLSQAAQAERSEIVPGGYGHGCGHSVFGTASVYAAIAAKTAAERAGIEGQIRCYGCPAEEILVGKVFMVRDGCFDGADAILAWHPSDQTGADFISTKAMVSVRFTFHGRASHAAADPFRGRSALDAVELMSVGVNYMREHIKEDARIHYVITDGGVQPNVVPPRASVWYYVRADAHTDVETYLAWVTQIADGAAMMTQTRVERSIDTDGHEQIPCRVLAEAMDRNLQRVGPPRFDDDDRAFAARLRETIVDAPPGPPLSTTIETIPVTPKLVPGSSDVGDVSWFTPVGHLRAATQALGAPGHSWQITACAGGPIGEKGGVVAAKALACTLLDLLTSSELRREARSDWQQRRGDGPYVSLLTEGQLPPFPKTTEFRGTGGN
jgi:aminobenzoyl-glutamate utilization protein B